MGAYQKEGDRRFDVKGAAVAIGVDRTGGLPTLGGAASGAAKFSSWATNQGMDVRLITDRETPVRATDVLDAIQEIVDSRLYTRLTVFFAGHGYLLGPQTELWLLSGAPRRSAEAVNVSLSREFARGCGIPHVIFVSDACRSGGANHQHRSVVGSAIFPNEAIDSDVEVDTFYATRPGEPALEYQDPDEAIANHQGIFTECLLDALERPKRDEVSKLLVRDTTRWVIPCRPIKKTLVRKVPQRASEISIKLQQSPEVRVESALPHFFGEVHSPPLDSRGQVEWPNPSSESAPGASESRPRGEVGTTPGLDLEDLSTSLSNLSDLADWAPVGTPRELLGGSIEAQLMYEVAQIDSSTARESFETDCGFTVFGSLDSVVARPELGIEHWYEDGATHIRVANGDSVGGSSLLLQFANGTGSVLAVMPGFIGAVVLDANGVANVNYTPSRGNDLFWEYESNKNKIGRRRAVIAAATRHGVFEYSDSGAIRTADYLRMEKHIDPTLGIYAAYAYQGAGKADAICSVLRYMERDSGLIPYDVALLSRKRTLANNVAPFCPMLTQGWALLELDANAPGKLFELRRMLIPSLWATFTHKGVTLVADAIGRGDLK